MRDSTKIRTFWMGLVTTLVVMVAAAGPARAADCRTNASLCDDKNPCTRDVCSVLTGRCSHVNLANGTSCSDGSACTSSDACSSGVCRGTTVSCDDKNACTSDSCNTTSGCQHANVANGTSCNDSSACTSSDACASGVCRGTAISCDDGNACTSDSCNAASGCQHANVANGTSCNDSSACTSSDACTSGVCRGTAVSCDDANPCTSDSCDPTKGCLHANNTASCNDGSACTANDVCAAGVCRGTAVSCDDGNPCTNDSCDPTKGCLHANNTASCNDGSACTANDVCSAGVCRGTAVSCDDGNPCTNDSCDPTKGCVHANNTASCNDGSACTANDVCSAGVCAGAVISCDDSNTCTDDSCDPAKGCQHLGNLSPCDDHDRSTRSDVCDGSGVCTGTPYTCPVGPCEEAEVPNGVGCDILYMDLGSPCDDANDGTRVDSCDGHGGCAGEAYTCSAGACEAASVPDGDGCQVTYAATGTGCDDGLSGTRHDVCDGAGGCAGEVYTCAASACQAAATPNGVDCDVTPKADGTGCDDGDPCTSGDACKNGACVSGAPMVCTAPPGACYANPGTCTSGGCQYAYDSLACAGVGVALTTVLDEAGNGLEGAAAEVWSLSGWVAVGQSDDTGRVSLATEPGTFVWRFSKEGHVPVVRVASVPEGQVTVVPSPWLATRQAGLSIAPSAGVTLTCDDGAVAVTVPAGSVDEAATMGLAALDGQTLPGLLPRGWSPLQAFVIESSVPLEGAVSVDVDLWDELAAGDEVALVAWDEIAVAWSVVLRITPGAKQTSASFTLDAEGAYAVVVADARPLVPPHAVAGQYLVGVSAVDPSLATLHGTGRVTPDVSLAALDAASVTATAVIGIAAASDGGPLTSGLPFTGQIENRYDFVDGTREVTDPASRTFVAYQRPAFDSAAAATIQFLTRPDALYAVDELREGSTIVSLASEGASAGTVIDQKGGRVTAGDLALGLAAGDLVGPRAVRLLALDAGDFAIPDGDGMRAVLAFRVELDGLAEGHHATIALPKGQANAAYVLARAVLVAGSGGTSARVSGLEPVERFGADAQGVLHSLETSSADHLRGIDASGRYVLVRLAAPVGVVRASVTDDGHAVAAAPVAIAATPWLAPSDASGDALLVAPVGTSLAHAWEAGTTREAFADVVRVDATAEVSVALGLGLVGPRVVKTTPDAGADNVSTVAPLTVIFSEPVRFPSGLEAAVVLVPTGGDAVALTPKLAPDGKTLSVAAVEPLEDATTYTLTLAAAAIVDSDGLTLTGPTSVTLTTRPAAARGAAAQLVIYAPGAKNTPCNPALYDPSATSTICVAGSQGSADPGAAVVLMNEDTGVTATVNAAVDGSFQGSLPATMDDFVAATFVNGNGTTVYLPVSEQRFDSGHLGLYHGGGTLEAKNESGKSAQVIFEPSAIAEKILVKLDVLSADEISALLADLQTATWDDDLGVKALGAMHFQYGGDALAASADVVFPVTPGEVAPLLPSGIAPEDAGYALTVRHEDENGAVTYQVVDRMHYETNAKGEPILTTHSFPFVGLMPAGGDGGNLVGYTSLSSVYLCPFYIGGHAQALTGHVYSCPVASEAPGKCLTKSDGTPNLTPLAGATVFSYPTDRANPAPGKLPRGAAYAVSDEHGTFALMGTAGESGVTLMATHPAYPMLATSYATPLVHGNDLVFFVDEAAIKQQALERAPVIQSYHTPSEPPVGVSSPATLVVVASHASGVPSVEILPHAVTSLVDGVTVQASDVSIVGPVKSEPVGATGARLTYTITATKALRLALEIRAAAQGQATSAAHVIDFGGSVPHGVNTLTPPDPNDRQGPYVATSWPAQFSTGLAPGQPITVTFNEPIDRGIEKAPGLIRLLPDVGTPTIALSADQRTLTITSSRLRPQTTYTLSLGTGIVDLLGNPFDQVPTTENARESYQLFFTTAALREATLPDMQFGTGAVVKGQYAYALERSGPLDGALYVYDLADPTKPTKVAELDLPPHPNDLTLVDRYQFVRKAGGAAETKNLLAIVGGRVGVVEPWLWVVDIASPGTPVRLSGEWVSPNPRALITKVTWSAPNLAYLEFDGDHNSVSLVNLQMFIYAESLATADYQASDYPQDGRKGVDANGDGDFADPGDTLPLPAATSFTYAGKVASYAITDTTQAIVDYDYDARNTYLGVVLDAGVTTADQKAAPPSYRTLLASGYVGGIDLPRAQADFAFDAGVHMKRLLTLFAVPIADVPHDLALVSLIPATGDTTTLAVLDISSVTSVQQLGAIPIPAMHGIVQSAVVQDDGLVRVNTSKDALILDPTRLALPCAACASGGEHPAIVGVIPGAGVSQVTLEGHAFGLTVVNHGAKTMVVQSAPALSFVYFPTAAALVEPADLVDDAQAIAEMAAAQTPVTALPLSRFRAEGGAVATLDPASTKTHYYVRISAPGAAGATIDLALESLDAAGVPLPRRGLGFPSVNAISAAALAAIGQTPQAGEPTARALKAYRLSSDPTSSDYNVYLSEPFALVAERMSATTLQTLTGSRAVLWSGSWVRAAIDPSMASNAVLGPFAANASAPDQRIYPGPAIVAPSLPGDYLMGPNPTPIGGMGSDLTLDGTAGHVRAINGDMTASAVDLALAGRRLPIVFARFLAAQDLHEGPLGRGWDSPSFQRLSELTASVFKPGSKLPIVVRGSDATNEIAATSDLLFYDGRGRTVVYRHVSDTEVADAYIRDPLMRELGWLDKISDSYLPPRGLFDALVRFQSGQFARLTPDGTQFWYGPTGRLEKICDRYPANALTFDYNDEGQLVAIRDAASLATGGRYVRFGYYRPAGARLFQSGLDEATNAARWIGKMARIEDHTGRDVLYLYDDAGKLRQVRGIEVAHSATFTGRATTDYGWSSDGRLATVTDPGASGDPTFAVTAKDTAGESATAGTGHGGSVGIALATANSAAAVAQGGAATHVTRADGSQSEIDFDVSGRPKAVTAGAGSADPRSHLFEMNDDGLVTKVTKPNGEWIEYAYDTQNANLRARGNLVSVVRHAGVGGGATLTASWPASGYDLRYNLPAGTTTDFAGNVVEVALTSDGRGIETRTFKDGATLTTAGEEQLGYNAYGQLTSRRDPASGVAETWQFGDDGFVETHVVGDGSAEALTTKFVYVGDDGRRGLPTTIDLGRGGDVQLAYSARGELVARKRGGRTETWAYDAAGRLVETTETIDTALTRVVTYGYVRGNFLETVRESGVKSSDTGTVYDLVTTYVPDALGRVAEVKLPGGQKIDTTYYDNGELATTTQGDIVTLQAYDPKTNTSVLSYGSQDSDKFLTRVFDGHGRLAALSTAAPGAGLGRNDARVEYSYDGRGAVLSTSVYSQAGLDARTELDHDALGRVLAERHLKDDGTFATTTASYPVPGQAIVTGPTGVTTASLADAAGRPGQETLAIPGVSVGNAGRTVVQHYDANGNLATRDVSDGIGSDHLAWSYDDLDHMTGMTDALGVLTAVVPRLDGLPLSVTDALQHTTTFAHSQLGELLLETRPDGVAIHRAYDQNRAPAAVGDNAGKGVAMTYDRSLLPKDITARNGLATHVDRYDVMGHVTAATLPGGGTLEATYDTRGLLMARKTATPEQRTTDDQWTLDGLGRSLLTQWQGGTASYTYDKLGPAKAATYTLQASRGEVAASFGATHRDDGARTSLTYPTGLKVIEARDAAGRITGITAGGDALVGATTYASSERIGTRSLNGGRLLLENAWDSRGRLLRRTFKNAGGAVLSDDRYAYDAIDNPVAHQAVHRAGRTDFYALDADSRLVRADLDARPSAASERVPAFDGFAVPAEVGGAWSAGTYARAVHYDEGGLDLVEGITPINPYALELPPLADTFANPDDSLAMQVVGYGGYTLQRGPADGRGNIQKALLHARWEDVGVVPIEAQLGHDALDRLAEVAGSQTPSEPLVTLGYDPDGYLFRREVRCASSHCAPSETLYLWDGARLVEEYDARIDNVRALYFYAEGDVPVAADLVGDDGHAGQYDYLTDALGSVTGVVDAATGEVVERVSYDPWGQPSFELRDTLVPEVAVVDAKDGALVVQFTEEVTPPLATTTGDALVTNVASIADAASVKVNGVATGVTVAYDAARSGYAYGSVVTLTFAKTPKAGDAISLEVGAGKLVDRWSNGNRAATLAFTWTGVNGARLASAKAFGTTAPVRAVRSSVGNRILWQGQLFDYDTGFYYLRGRWYDPAGGSFLEQDPRAYEDSTNPYQAMANNPTRFRDPSGHAAVDFGEWLKAKADEGATWLSDQTYGHGTVARGLAFGAGFALGSAGTVAEGLVSLGAGMGRWWGTDWRARTLGEHAEGVMDAVGTGLAFAGPLTKLGGMALESVGDRIFGSTFDDAFRSISWPEYAPKPPPERPYALINGKKVYPTGMGNVLYYGDDFYKPDYVYEHGLPERGPNLDLIEHANPRRLEGTAPSAFRGATEYAKCGDSGAAYWTLGDGWVFKFDGMPSWDVNGLLAFARRDPNGGFLNNLMRGEVEFAVPGRIPRERILGAHYVGPDYKLGPFVPNPNYVPLP